MPAISITLRGLRGLLTASISHNSVFGHRPCTGGKVGYYLDEPGWQWLEIEMEAFTSTQHLKQQGVDLDSSGVSTNELTRGQNVRVTNWSPVSIMFRYQIGRFEPYVGGGLGIYFLHVYDAATDTSMSSNANMGLSTKGGLRWRVRTTRAVRGMEI